MISCAYHTQIHPPTHIHTVRSWCAICSNVIAVIRGATTRQVEVIIMGRSYFCSPLTLLLSPSVWLTLSLSPVLLSSHLQTPNSGPCGTKIFLHTIPTYVPLPLNPLTPHLSPFHFIPKLHFWGEGRNLLRCSGGYTKGLWLSLTVTLMGIF